MIGKVRLFGEACGEEIVRDPTLGVSEDEFRALRQMARSESGIIVAELNLACDRYRLLEKLVTKGNAAKYGERAEGPRCNVYHITDQGREVVEAQMEHAAKSVGNPGR